MMGSIIGIDPSLLLIQDGASQIVIGDESGVETFDTVDPPDTIHRRLEGLSFQQLLQSVRIVPDRVLAGDQHQIGGVCPPDLHRVESDAQSCQGSPYDLAVNLVSLQPLNEDPILIQSFGHRLVEITSEKAGDSGPVGIRWLREDKVVAIRRGEQDLPAVTDNQADLGVLHRLLIDIRTVLGNARDVRLELDDIDPLNRRNFGHPARSTPNHTTGTHPRDRLMVTANSQRFPSGNGSV